MTIQLQVVGWHYGLKKIQLTKLFQDACAMPLGEAKHATDNLLDGQVIHLVFNDAPTAREVAHRMQLLGAVIHSPNISPALLHDHFIVWMGQQLISILRTPQNADQHFQVTRDFLASFVNHLQAISFTEHAQIIKFLDLWANERNIMGESFPNTKAADVFLEGIIGTIVGILESE